MNKNLLAGLIIAIASILFFVFVLPEINFVLDMRSEIAARSAMLPEIQSIVSKAEENYKTVSSDAEAKDKINKIVPDKKSLAEVVSGIDSMASSNGIRIDSISFSEVNKSAESTGAYKIMAIELELAGSYGGIMEFLKMLESQIRVSDVRSFEVSRNTNSGELNMKLGFHVYYLDKDVTKK